MNKHNDGRDYKVLRKKGSCSETVRMHLWLLVEWENFTYPAEPSSSLAAEGNMRERGCTHFEHSIITNTKKMRPRVNRGYGARFCK